MTGKGINNHIFAFLLFLFFFLQLTFVPQFFSNAIMPNLVLMLLLSASLLFRSSDIFYISFASGFLLDVFSGEKFGVMTAGVTFSVFVSSYLGFYFLKELFSLNLFLIVFAGVITYNIVYFALINPNVAMIENNFYQLFTIVLFELIYAFFLSYPLTYALSYKK